MIKKQIEVTKPFNAKKKTFPDGTIKLTRYKFTAYGIEEGYECVDEDRRVCETLQTDKRRETYASFVQDWKDKKEMRAIESRCSMVQEGSSDLLEALAIVYKPKDSRLSEPNLERQEERRRKKVLYNIAKTRNKIFDIASANDFNYFITLTYSAEKCDRYSFQECSKKVRKFMDNFRREHLVDCPNFKYLLVHEQHKDGAYHYHGLIYLENTDTLKLADRQPKGCKYPVYNWGRWKNGFSTVTEIQDKDATRKYILKYISKNIDEDYVKGQRHFYYSQNCAKPTVEKLMITDDDILSLYDEVYDTDRSIGYETTVESLQESIDLISDFRYGVV